MKKPSELLESHLEKTVTTHCFAWIIRRKDGGVLGFTDHDRNLVVVGISCEPQSGMNRSETSETLGLSASSSEIEGALTSARISEKDIESGVYDGADVEIYLVNWCDPTQFRLMNRWSIGRISRSDHRFVAEVRGQTTHYNKMHGRRVLRQCDAEFGDQRCQMNKNDPALSAQGTVSHIDLPDIVVSGLGGYASSWFTDGRLTWLSGANEGCTAFIVLHAGSVIRLREPALFPIQTGDMLRIIAGCDKSFATCKQKFANSLNFQGFPHLPGNDSAYAYVSDDTNFDGGVLVP